MKHLDGMETARRIRQLDGEVLIIFITNTAQYAINGYSVGATDYMLKPVPVSYTHLDVYKRQSLSSSLLFWTFTASVFMTVCAIKIERWIKYD